jgi:hypothetical protein
VGSCSVSGTFSIAGSGADVTQCRVEVGKD